MHELGGFATFFSRRGDRSRPSRVGRGRRAHAGRDVRDRGACGFATTASSNGCAPRPETRLSLINLLSDVAHPTQAVADVLTIADEFADGDVDAAGGPRGRLRRRRHQRDPFPGGRAASSGGQRHAWVRPPATSSSRAGREDPFARRRRRHVALSRRRRRRGARAPTWSTPTRGSPWASRTRPRVGARTSRPFRVDDGADGAAEDAAPSCCTACRRTAATRSPTRCSTAHSRACGARCSTAVPRWWACFVGSKRRSHDQDATTTPHRRADRSRRRSRRPPRSSRGCRTRGSPRPRRPSPVTSRSSAPSRCATNTARGGSWWRRRRSSRPRRWTTYDA